MFLLDFITLFPFYITFISEIKIFELAYLLRLIKLRKLILLIEEDFHLSDQKQYISKVIKLLFSVLYLTHIFGCILHSISYLQVSRGSNNTWLNIHNLIDENWFVRYVNSVYFAVLTMITVGYPNTNSLVDKISSIFILIILSSVFGYAISIIGIILQEMNKIESDLKLIIIIKKIKKIYKKVFLTK